MTLAALFFLRPLLLLGLLAVAVPILVHLLLRPRPQRVRFPAIALLWPALLAGQRAGRVRNAALLAARIAVLAFAAVLLAGPTCSPRDAAAAREAAAAVVLLLDDSASMGFITPAGPTCLKLAHDEAHRRLDALAAAGRASVAILYSRDNETPVFEAPAAARRRLKPPTGDAHHARTLRPSLIAAARALAASAATDRRLIVLTDLTAQAWIDVEHGPLAGLENLQVEVVGPAAEPRANLAATSLTLPGMRVPAGAACVAGVDVAAADIAGPCWISGRTDFEVLPRSPPLEAPPGGRRSAALAIPPHPAGPHALRIRVEPDDRLAFDQERFAVFEAGPRPVVWLLAAERDPAAEPEITTLLVRNLLAPTALDDAAQLVDLERPTVATLTAPTAAAPDAALVVAIGGAPLTAPQARALLAQVEAGATLLLLPRAGADGGDWPGLRPLLATAAPSLDTRAAATTMVWNADSPYARPAAAPGDLAGIAIRRRLALPALSESARIDARYSDGLPAIVSKPVGRGRVVLLSTSPDPDWSDLAIEAAGLLTWLHTLLAESLGPPASVAEFSIHEQTTHRFAALPDHGSVRVVGPAGDAARAVWIALESGTPRGGWPTDRAGLYAIHAAADGPPTARYAVNWPAAESDLTPIDADALRGRLGRDLAVSHVDRPGATAGADRVRWGDARTWMAGLLLGALLAEGWLAGRSIRPAAGA